MRNSVLKQYSWAISFATVLLLAGPTLAECPADVNNDGIVNVSDLLLLLGGWGSCDVECTGDANQDGSIDVSDLLMLLGAWGPCPVDECPFECLEVDLFCAFQQGAIHPDLPCSDGGYCCEVPQREPCPHSCTGDLFVCMAEGGTYLQEYECSNGMDCCLE